MPGANDLYRHPDIQLLARKETRHEAILRATGDMKCGGHVLKKLYGRYEELYPDQELHFDLPFGFGYLGFTPEQVAEMQKEEPQQDQMYRYHTNLDGERWEGVDRFDAAPFLRTLDSLKKTIIDIGRRIHWKPDGLPKPSM